MLPAQYLNDIFVNFENKEATNCPKYVKNYRSFNLNFDSSEYSDDSDYSDCSDLSKSSTSSNLSDKSESNASIISFDSLETDSLLDEFINHVPKWGAIINFNGNNIRLTDTCSIDYFLLALWYLSKLISSFLENIPVNFSISALINEIVHEIDNKQWDRAREIWILQVVKTFQVNRGNISLFGGVDEMFINYFLNVQSHRRLQRC